MAVSEINKPFLKTTYKKVFIKYLIDARFRSMYLLSVAIFLQKGHNSGENGRIRKQNTLVLKTVYIKGGFHKILGQCKVFFIVFALWEWIFELFLAAEGGENKCVTP